jgi:hypothetical protein
VEARSSRDGEGRALQRDPRPVAQSSPSPPISLARQPTGQPVGSPQPPVSYASPFTPPCPRSSLYDSGREQRGHHRRSRGRCGITLVLRQGNRRRPTWLPCGQLTCGYCGPRLIAERIAHYKVCTKWRTVYAHLVDRGDWDRVRKQLYRKRIDWVKFDRRGQFLSVLASEPLFGVDNAPVEPAALADWLTRQFKALPAGGLVRSSKAWALAQMVDHHSGWTVEGITSELVDDVLDLARTWPGMQVERGVITPPDEQAWAVLAKRIRLHQPDHGRPRPEEPEKPEEQAA